MSGPEEPPRPPAPPTQPTERLGPPLPETEPLVAPVPPRRVEPVAPAPPRVVEHVGPPLPPDPWWSNPGPAILAGILGLILGGVLGYVIGNQNESTREARTGRAAVTVTHTVTTRPPAVVHTTTVTDKTVTQTPAPVSPAGEQRRSEAEASVRKLERENEELRRHQEEG